MKRKIAVTSTFASMAIALMASPALSQDTSAKPSDGTTISCDNPLFAKDTSHARLVAHFGATNVAVRQMAGDFDDDPPVYFSRINPKDSRKGLVLVWADGKAMSQLQYIMIERASEWTAPHGLRAGATLDELENALGKVAQISIGRTQGDRSRQFSANGVFVQELTAFRMPDCCIHCNGTEPVGTTTDKHNRKFCISNTIPCAKLISARGTCESSIHKEPMCLALRLKK